MRIGDLNKRVILQAATLTSDGMGGGTTVWNDVGSVYAAVWPVSAKEQLAGGQTTMEITHRVRIRYRLNLSAKWRIKLDDRYFSIVSVVNPNESGKMLDLLCKEATA